MSASGRDGPPRPAAWLLGACAPRDDRALLLADLEERFGAIAHDRGIGAARRWYWWQAVRGVVALTWPDPERLQRHSWRGALGDARQAARTLRRRPAYTVGVVGTFAIGLASATAVLSVAWHVWLAPMPFPDPDRVVRLFEVAPSEDGGVRAEGRRWRLSPPLLEDLRAHEWSTVAAVAGVSPEVFDWTSDAGTARASALAVSPELFEILGIAPLVGRTLSHDDEAAEVVLTESFWRRAFGGDAAVVGGGSMTLGGEPHTIVGVARLPTGYPGTADLLVPLHFSDDELVAGMRGARYLDVVARVAPGASVGEASAELDRLVRTLGGTFPNHAGWGGDAVVLSDELMRPYRGVLSLLLAAGSIFLALAIVNVAGLVAARVSEEGRERTIRLALGASRWRLLRESAVESVLLAAVGAAGALVLAYWLLGPIVSLVPAEVPRISNVSLSPGIGGGMIVIAVAVGGGVGVVGRLLAGSVGSPARLNSRTATPRLTGRSALVVGQITLTTLLAISGAGIVRRMASLQSVDLGFDAEGVVYRERLLSAERYPTPEARLTYWRTLLEAAEARGLVVAVGTNPPMAGVNMPWGWRRDETTDQSFAQYHIVSSEYFDVLGIEVLEGRTFTEDDRAGSERVLVVNERVAAAAFPGEQATGRVIGLLGRPATIVGVVRATHHFGPSDDAPEEIYVPIGHDPWPNAHVLVQGEAASSVTALDAVLRAHDPMLGVGRPTPYSAYVAAWFAALRLQLIIVGVLATVGTLLAMLGLYALIAYHVASQRREIGVRMALGASDARMFSSVVRRGVGLAAAGLLVGLAVWYATLPLSAGLLGDVDAADPLLSGLVAVLVATVALVASALPAWRSAAVDPAITLRDE